MQSPKQKRASKRNFSKMRIAGMITSLSTFNIVTEEERKIILEAKEKLQSVLKEWDNNTKHIL